MVKLPNESPQRPTDGTLIRKSIEMILRQSLKNSKYLS